MTSKSILASKDQLTVLVTSNAVLLWKSSSGYNSVGCLGGVFSQLEQKLTLLPVLR